VILIKRANLFSKIKTKVRNNFINRLYKRMFKDIQRGLAKFFTPQRVLVLMVFIILSFVLLAYSNSKSNVIDLMTDGSMPVVHVEESKPTPSVLPELVAPSASASPPPTENGYALRPVANPSDLLPQDSNSQWGEMNSLNQGNIAMPDLLQAGYHIGLDTIGQTLRNANLQIRSDPIIPKSDIGPWNQSTIEPDFGRVPIEVGYGPR
jgi:hypothetical protein